MSELQNESIDSDITEPVENVEQPEEVVADLATDSEAEHEQQPQQEVDEEAKKQEAINKAINKKHYEAKQAQRERDELAQKLEQLEMAERARKAEQIGNIPAMPDPFDDDFEAKVRQRDEALSAKAQFDAQQAVFRQQQELQAQQAQQAKAAELQKTAASYNQKAVEFGIKAEELQAAGNTVAQYGLSDDLVLHILNDSDGPLITKHLAANPQKGIELAQMSPYSVGVQLEIIKNEAKALKPKASSAPKPSSKLDGAAIVPDGRYKNIGGAKFE